jgi:hypothetical protein
MILLECFRIFDFVDQKNPRNFFSIIFSFIEPGFFFFFLNLYFLRMFNNFFSR